MDKNNKSIWWSILLGEDVENDFQVPDVENKCYKCESKNIEHVKSVPWTGKHHCNDCGYYTYIVYQDRMGGGLTDNVSISKNDLNFKTD